MPIEAWASADESALDRLIDRLGRVRAAAFELEAAHAGDLELVPEPVRASARNLLHYLALRRHDLRDLQVGLSRIGLSSLGRTEANVLAGLDAVLVTLHRLRGRAWEFEPPPTPPIDPRTAREPLDIGAERLLGAAPAQRGVRIMVTMPAEAAHDAALVDSLLAAGMDVARINAAHDDASVWSGIADNLRRAQARTGATCRILFDLAGPKLRTRSLGDGPRILRVKPRRDVRGRVVRRACLRFSPADAPASPPAVPIDRALIEAAREGDRLELRDASGRRRRIEVIGKTEQGLLGESDRSLRLESGATIRLRRAGETLGESRIGPLPPLEIAVTLQQGDELLLVGSDRAPHIPQRGPTGALDGLLVIPTTLDGLWPDLHVGESIRFDDGRIDGVIVEALPDSARVRVLRVPTGGAKLRGDKGINLPGTTLTIDCPTARDLRDLDWAVGAADMVGMSFVERPEELLRLEDALAERNAQHLGIVLKIETEFAFRSLPHLLLAGLRSPPVGVMVARGDLAVEVGFARLAEVQEEILWLCEAAHVPVIWATQVLESLAKGGLPSRAEVSDAAMGVHAECVMLNKGPFVVDAVRLLGDVLQRMRAHHSKKRSLLRELNVSWLGASRP